MARRKQLKGVAWNLVKWCFSRNFDYKGYWAVGQLYAYALENESSEYSIDLIRDYVLNESVGSPFWEVNLILLNVLRRDVESLQIPDWWIKSAAISFSFNTDYQQKYHYWGSGLGGQPCMCEVKIMTDQGKVYSKEFGRNVWSHNPRKEQRRYGF